MIPSDLFKFLPRLVLPVQGVLVALVGWQLGITTWQLLPPSAGPASVVTPSLASGTSKTRSDTLSALGSLKIFGSPPVAAPAEMTAPTVAPVSRLPAKITGLVASSDPQQSLVIIRMNGQDAIYHIGEVLKGANARIENIFPDRVIIDHNGKFESLLMYPDEADQPQLAIGSVPPVKTLSLKERLQQNPSSWSDIVSIAPAMSGGQMQGYRLNPGKQPELFRKYGLQPGDLATAINGQSLDNPQELMQLMSELANARSMSLAIERNGQPMEVQIEL